MRRSERFRLSLTLAAIGLAAFAGRTHAQTDAASSAFDRLKALAGTWEADSPAGGKLTSTFVLVSKGTAIEETIGTPAENEVSLYTRDAGRIVMTHYCALTAQGNQPRLEAPVAAAGQREFIFSFVGADNLSNAADAHMHRMVLRLKDPTHLSEEWTKRENGKDTVFALGFIRR
ncbi:MAG TPA: hypothetical protein VN924_18115 [Bryobacteraceae bacterium]|nr:hypothetical protein [Bryobacteraceae bacterium]